MGEVPPSLSLFKGLIYIIDVLGVVVLRWLRVGVAVWVCSV